VEDINNIKMVICCDKVRINQYQLGMSIEVIIAKGNRPVVKLVPFNHHTPERRLDSALGKIIISDNFDEPIDDFKEYMP
jgi:hypothetical protein